MLQWFPAIGVGEQGDIGSQIRHLVLPAFAVGISWVGYIARMVRASMLEVLGESHVRTARAFGLSEWRITFRYALPIAVLPRSEEHTSELQSLMRISYAVFCLQKTNNH